MNVGDFIKCHGAFDMIATSTELAKENIHTDFVYERNGVKGFWLEVISLDQDETLTLEEVKTKMCDHYCKVPMIAENQEEIDFFCKKCPLANYEG